MPTTSLVLVTHAFRICRNVDTPYPSRQNPHRMSQQKIIIIALWILATAPLPFWPFAMLASVMAIGSDGWPEHNATDTAVDLSFHIAVISYPITWLACLMLTLFVAKSTNGLLATTLTPIGHLLLAGLLLYLLW